MKITKFTPLIAAVYMAASLTACGDASPEPDSSKTPVATKAENIVSKAETEQITETETATVTGNVIASSVAIVEILDAMNVPMVGVPTSSYALPESVANATAIGNPMSPDMEVVTSLEPDFIISVNSLENTLGEQFSSLGAETYYADLSSFDSLKATISDLGKMFGKDSDADRIIADLESSQSSVLTKTEGKDAPEVLIIFGAGDSFMTACETTYVGDLVRLVGGKNVVENSPGGFMPVDMEYLAAKNPDYILLMAHANPEESLAALHKEFETNEAWQNFDAVANDKVYSLETGVFGMSANLQAGEALEKLADLLYGE